MKIVAILGIDNFSRKNKPQVDYFNNHGFIFDVYTNDCLGDSKINIAEQNRVFILEKTFLRRINQLVRYLDKEHKNIHHAEIYPAGRFAFIYLILCKIFSIKTIVVERGDLLFMDSYSFFVRISARLTYIYADLVWYREFYMANILKAYGVKRTFFLGNAVKTPSKKNISFNKKIDFLWVNRLIGARKSGWYVKALESDEFKNTNNAIAGFMQNSTDKEIIFNQTYITDKSLSNLKTYGYVDPEGLYLQAKYFVLPSDIVFCNHALLEAMSYGVVPLVSNVEGAGLIVEDNINGFVFEHTEEGLLKTMKKAQNLSYETYEKMAEKAVAKISQEYSYEAWGDKLMVIYNSI